VKLPDTTGREIDEQHRIAELERRISVLSVFHEVGKALTSTLELSRVLEIIMEQINTLFHPDTWSLLLVDQEKQELYFEIAVGEASEKLKNVRLKIGEGVAGWVAQHQQPVLVSDAARDLRFAPRVDAITRVETRTIVAVPIRGRESVLGVIELINTPESIPFGDREMLLLQALADYAAIALENARHMERIHQMTITDDCTKLFNSRHLHNVLESEIYRSGRYGYHFSVVFFDLDRFKQVNDTHGHLVGSKLLAEVGQLIKDHLRMIDLAFRYGGDEFVVLLPQTDKPAAINVARRLHVLLAGATFLREESINLKLTASFGVACYPEDAASKDELIRLADEAMYLVKNTVRNSIAAANVGLLREPT
jgi:diguanylate cyclase (GGDEF)-like protein